LLRHARLRTDIVCFALFQQLQTGSNVSYSWNATSLQHEVKLFNKNNGGVSACMADLPAGIGDRLAIW
jgi:hypothetical protein